MKRIQRQRTKGWRMPSGAIYVGRPTQWGNPYRGMDAETAVRLYRRWLDLKGLEILSFTAPLVGRDLVCWCPLDQPCHADVLLEVAQSGSLA